MEREAKFCARARAFNKVLRFFSRAAARRPVRRECLTAAMESHAGLHTKPTFLPTARCNLFTLSTPTFFRRKHHRAALISPLHAPSANSSAILFASRRIFPRPDVKEHFLPEPLSLVIRDIRSYTVIGFRPKVRLKPFLRAFE